MKTASLAIVEVIRRGTIAVDTRFRRSKFIR